MQKITKAILPVAGMGTRIMPLTFHQPKGMVGIVDRPVVHYIIDEILSGGIKEIILIISPNQSVFKKYIKHILLKDSSWSKIKFRFVVQEKPIGNGDAIYLAKKYIKNEPFVLCFGDDINVPHPISKMIDAFQATQSSVMLLQPVPETQVSRYGIVKPTKNTNDDLIEISDLIEKPKPEEAPSNLAIIGRYVLVPQIFEKLEKLYTITPAGKELYLTEGLKGLLHSGNKIYGLKFSGTRFDCGSKIGILQAQTYFAFHHPELKEEFKQHLKTLK